MSLKRVAEAVETVLLEKQIGKEISDYSIELIQDDNRIEVFVTKNEPVKEFRFNLELGKNFN